MFLFWNSGKTASYDPIEALKSAIHMGIWACTRIMFGSANQSVLATYPRNCWNTRPGRGKKPNPAVASIFTDGANWRERKLQGVKKIGFGNVEIDSSKTDYVH